MKTYQDLLAVGNNERQRMEFIQRAINEHKASALYRVAVDADMYYRHLNPTIMRAQKFIHDAMGRSVPDIYSANNKIPCRYYFYFVTSAVQYLLGNGVSFADETTKEKLGKDFDALIQDAATKALNGGVSYGFWNYDHLEVFNVGNSGTEPVFAPLYDEENGALSAGIRFWQVANDKPLRCTLYEIDGMTDYIKRKGKQMEVYEPKRSYKQIYVTSDVSGTTIYNGGNYPGFPIVPLFNVNHQSEIVGNRETIDAYDLMASALVNNIDDANIIYWVIRNAGGMDEVDDAKFVQRLRQLHVAHLEDNEEVDSHTPTVPFQASEAALEQLRKQLFDDFMALDVKNIASGATTATQIKAAYEPLNARTDLFEFEVTKFINSILAIAGIDDTPTYTRSIIVNQQEQINTLLAAAQYLSEDYVTKKIMETLGDIDKVEDVMSQIAGESMARFSGKDETKEAEGEEEQQAEGAE